MDILKPQKKHFCGSILHRKKGDIMKKIKQYKGFVIAQDKKEVFHVFTKDEWAFGEGCRYAEWECDNMQEAIDFIDSY